MAFDTTGLDANQLQSVKGALCTDASKYVNRDEVEYHWAMQTYHHAETYFNLISSVDPSILKLTKMDDEIYDHFRKEFPDMKIDVLCPDKLKSAEAKESWRPFCDSYKGKVEDFNMGTLIRTDCTEDYSEKNSFIVVRIQFLAIEIARNREGFNSGLRIKYKKTEEKESS